MLVLRKSDDRGKVDQGWLLARHSFSFGAYQDPAHMGFSDLRVINEDRVNGGMGFARHPHRNMEIVTYVLAGGLKHEDSMGHASILKPGDVQAMSAGSGVFHSEQNADAKHPVHLLQIWIIPDKEGYEPRYGEKRFAEDKKRGRFCLIVSPDGQDGSLPIYQDAKIHAALLDGAETLQYSMPKHRMTYVHVARGSVLCNDQRLEAGDALYLSGQHDLFFSEGQGAEILLFDLRSVPKN